MSLRLFNIWLILIAFVALFPVDSAWILYFLWLQIKITLLDCYMFLHSYWLYLGLRSQGIKFPFRYVSIRNRKPL